MRAVVLSPWGAVSDALSVSDVYLTYLTPSSFTFLSIFSPCCCSAQKEAQVMRQWGRSGRMRCSGKEECGSRNGKGVGGREQRMQRRSYLPRWPFLPPRLGPHCQGIGGVGESELMPGSGGSAGPPKHRALEFLEFFAVPAWPPCHRKSPFGQNTAAGSGPHRGPRRALPACSELRA